MGSTSRVPQVLIVGAGIAGLAAAGAIRGLGWDVDVVEQRADFDGAGTGLFFPANGVRALAALGVLDGLACRGRRDRPAPACAAPTERLEAAARLGPGLARGRPVDRCSPVAGAGGPAGGRAGAGADGHPADRHRDRRARRVRAVFGDGGTASYDLIVGADGAGSTVRGLLWPGAAACYGGESWWRGIVTCPAGLDDWTLSLCRAGNLIVIPVGAGMAYWGAGVSGEARFRDEHAGRAARVRERFADAAGVTATVLDLVTDDAAVQFSAAEMAWVEDPVAGRVVLIGDAWHAATPSMAQGGSMAAEDALVLARELGRDRRGGAIEDSLRRFAARRLPRVRHVQETTAMRNQLAALPWSSGSQLCPAGSRSA